MPYVSAVFGNVSSYILVAKGQVVDSLNVAASEIIPVPVEYAKQHWKEELAEKEYQLYTLVRKEK